VVCVHRSVGINRFTGQVHVQFFGDDHEHGWVGDKRLMAYEGLAAFRAKAEADASMRVKPSRLAAWTVAVNDAEQALHLSRLDRVRTLTYEYQPGPHKVSSPKKQKRSYRPKDVKTSSASEDKGFMDISAGSQDNASPPQKRRRRKSSLPVKQDASRLSDRDVPSSATESSVTSPDAKNTISSESESSTEQSTKGKKYHFTRCFIVMA